MKVYIGTLLIGISILVITACARGNATEAEDGTPSPETLKSPSYGHASDYSWLAGQVRVTAMQGSCTLLIYDPDAKDEYGGIVVLPSKIPGIKNEQWVVVKGKIDLGGSQVVCPGAQYSYLVTSIEPQK